MPYDWMPPTGDGYLKRTGGIFSMETPSGAYNPPIPQTDVTSLVSDLAGKAASSHTHAESDITSLVSDLAGKAASSHTHPASDIASGTIATARLGSGVADGTTFLRGDQQWAAPAAGGTNPEFIWQAQTTAAGITKTNINTSYIGLMGTSGANAGQILANISTFNRVEIAYRFNPNETGTYGIKIRNITDASDLVAALEFSASTGAQDRTEAVQTIAPPSSIKRYEVQVRGPTSTADPIYYTVTLRFHKV